LFRELSSVSLQMNSYPSTSLQRGHRVSSSGSGWFSWMWCWAFKCHKRWWDFGWTKFQKSLSV